MKIFQKNPFRLQWFSASISASKWIELEHLLLQMEVPGDQLHRYKSNGNELFINSGWKQIYRNPIFMFTFFYLLFSIVLAQVRAAENFIDINIFIIFAKNIWICKGHIYNLQRASIRSCPFRREKIFISTILHLQSPCSRYAML